MSKKYLFLILAIVLLLLTSGCKISSFRTPYVYHTKTTLDRATVSNYKLNETKDFEIKKLLGEPSQIGRFKALSGQGERWEYYYQGTGEDNEAYVIGIVPSRRVYYSFVDGVLASFMFHSSYRNDNTNFDEKRMTEIKKGMTTKDDVKKIFGSPNGITVYPIINKGFVQWRYGISTNTLKKKFLFKIMSIQFDDKNLVDKVWFEEGEK